MAVASILDDCYMAFHALLVAIATPFSGDSGALFLTVYQQGTQIDETLSRLAILELGQENADVPEKTSKLQQEVVFTVKVGFGTDAKADEDADVTPTRVAFEILKQVKNAIHADRTLGGKAINTIYIGSGSELLLVGDTKNPGRWMLRANFRVVYRHSVTDANVQV